MYGKPFSKYCAKWVYGSDLDREDMINALSAAIVSQGEYSKEAADEYAKEIHNVGGNSCSMAWHILEGFKFKILSDTTYSIGEGTMINRVFTIGEKYSL